MCVGISHCMKNEAQAHESGTLKTVSRATDVIDVLLRHRSIGVTALADQLSLSKSTAHTYLKTLENCGYVVRNGNEYTLSYELSLLGESIRNQSYLYQIARDEIDELANETGQYAHLTIEENGKAINLYQAKGDDAATYNYQNRKVQQPEHLHMTATGKAILAALPKSTVRSILDIHGLPRQTPNTITERDALFEELAAISDRGYAYNEEEEIQGFRAVGAPICGSDGTVLGAVSVSGPTGVLNDDLFHEECTELVTRTANLIEVTINMSSEQERSRILQ